MGSALPREPLHRAWGHHRPLIRRGHRASNPPGDTRPCFLSCSNISSLQKIPGPAQGVSDEKLFPKGQMPKPHRKMSWIPYGSGCEG